jgi:hypothetical protein
LAMAQPNSLPTLAMVWSFCELIEIFFRRFHLKFNFAFIFISAKH